MPARPSRRPRAAPGRRSGFRRRRGAEGQDRRAPQRTRPNPLLRKNLNKGFFDIGAVLREIQQRKLYEAKGYGSFEAFLEREIDLGKTTALRLIKISVLFVKAGALEYGMDRLFQAVQALETSGDAPVKSGPTPPPAQQSNPRLALPLKPPLGRVG